MNSRRFMPNMGTSSLAASPSPRQATAHSTCPQNRRQVHGPNLNYSESGRGATQSLARDSKHESGSCRSAASIGDGLRSAACPRQAFHLAGMVGHDFFKRYAVTFDFENMKIVLQ
jgi:hypothetical protein